MLDPRFFALDRPHSLAELVEGLNVDFDPKFQDELIQAPSSLANAKPLDICFFQNKNHKADLESCKATACFVTEKLAPLVGDKHIIPIISETPRAHFARVCSKLVKANSHLGDTFIHKGADVHDTAIIEDGVEIGQGVKIGPFAVIQNGVTIGENTIIGAHVTLSHCDIGEACHIKANSVLGGAGFGVAGDESGLIDIPHYGRVIVGNRVSIGSQCCIDRGQLGDTVLADDVKIDNLVQVAHNVQIGQRTVIAGQVGISGSCVIGANVQMGGNAGLADHLNIGDGAVVAARAGVMHDIPAGEMWSGIPAMPIREHMRIVNATRKLVTKPKRDPK